MGLAQGALGETWSKRPCVSCEGGKGRRVRAVRGQVLKTRKQGVYQVPSSLGAAWGLTSSQCPWKNPCLPRGGPSSCPPIRSPVPFGERVQSRLRPKSISCKSEIGKTHHPIPDAKVVNGGDRPQLRLFPTLRQERVRTPFSETADRRERSSFGVCPLDLWRPFTRHFIQNDKHSGPPSLNIPGVKRNAFERLPRAPFT